MPFTLSDQIFAQLSKFKSKFELNPNLAPGDKLIKYHNIDDIYKCLKSLNTRTKGLTLETLTLSDLVDIFKKQKNVLSDRIRTSESVNTGRFMDGTEYTLNTVTQNQFEFKSRNKPIILLLGRCQTESIGNEIWKRLHGKVDVINLFTTLYIKKIKLDCPIDLLMFELANPIGNRVIDKRFIKFNRLIYPTLPPLKKEINFTAYDDVDKYKPHENSKYLIDARSAPKDKKDDHITRPTLVELFDGMISDVVQQFNNNYNYKTMNWK